MGSTSSKELTNFEDVKNEYKRIKNEIRQKVLKLSINECYYSLRDEKNYAYLKVKEEGKDHITICSLNISPTGPISLSIDDFIEIMKKEFDPKITFEKDGDWTKCTIIFE